jgi:hypothetical protein
MGSSKPRGDQTDNRLKVAIRRYSPRVDKKIRDKDQLWIRWNVQSNVNVKNILHYFMVLRPIMKKLASDNGLQYNNEAIFLHSKNLKPLIGAQLLADKAQFYNFHAQKRGWTEIPERSGANIWRHAFATTEMDKYYNGTDYHWCTTAEQAAKIVGLFMNSSAREVMDTYSSRRNDTTTSAAAAAAAGRSTHVFELSSDDDEDIVETPSKRLKTNRS